MCTHYVQHHLLLNNRRASFPALKCCHPIPKEKHVTAVRCSERQFLCGQTIRALATAAAAVAAGVARSCGSTCPY